MLLVFEINLVIVALLGFTGFSGTGAVEKTFPKNCTETILTRTEYKYVVVPVYKKINACCSTYAETSNSIYITACEKGKYGKNCQLNCSCPENAELCCDRESGNLTCYPGKTGINCTEDCNGRCFGHQCKYKCLRMNNSTCNPFDGSCNCSSGFKVKNCEHVCQEGSYGVNCGSICNCSDRKMCNPISGDCQCRAGWKGDKCTEVCSSFMFGSDCAYVCDCVKENTRFCDNVNGTCVCKPGWRGTRCQNACSNFTFGTDCAHICLCLEENTRFCDNEYGTCVCNPGWKGRFCEYAITGPYDIPGAIAATCVLVLAAVIVLASIIRKRKQSINAVQPKKDNENPTNFTNADYSAESQHLYQNETNTSTVIEFSIAKRQSNTTKDTTRSQFIHTVDSHHIKFNPGKDDKEVTFVYSYLAGNLSSNGNDGSTYDVSYRGRSDFVYNAVKGVLRTISEADDTYDATA